MPLVVAGLLPDVPASLGASVCAPSFAVRREVNCFLGYLRTKGRRTAHYHNKGYPSFSHMSSSSISAAMFSSEWNREQQPAMLHWLCDRLLSWLYVRG